MNNNDSKHKKMNSRFFQNTQCESFPCHRVDNTEGFNCLFCYCPLYASGEGCNGNYTFTKDGIKDCSGCTVPHESNNYEEIVEKIKKYYGIK